MIIKVRKLQENAVLPRQAKPGDAGFDLVATDMEFRNNYIEYSTGLAVEIPPGYAGFVFPRSSISKTGLSLANSVPIIDSGYRGEILLRFYCFASPLEGYRLVPYGIGDRIAQLIVLPVPEMGYDFVEELSITERGSGGFGHTGD